MKNEMGIPGEMGGGFGGEDHRGTRGKSLGIPFDSTCPDTGWRPQPTRELFATGSHTSIEDISRRMASTGTPAAAQLRRNPLLVRTNTELVKQVIADKDLGDGADQASPMVRLLTRSDDKKLGRVRVDTRDLPEPQYTGTPDEDTQVRSSIKRSNVEPNSSRQSAGLGTSPEAVVPDIQLDRELADTPYVVVGGGSSGVETAAFLSGLGYRNFTVLGQDKNTKGVWQRGSDMMEDRERNNPIEFSWENGRKIVLPRAPGAVDAVELRYGDVDGAELSRKPKLTRGHITGVNPGGDRGHEIYFTEDDGSGGKVRSLWAPAVINRAVLEDDTTLTPHDVQRQSLLNPKNDRPGNRWRENCPDEKTGDLVERQVIVMDFGNGRAEILLPKQDLGVPRDASSTSTVTEYLSEVERTIPGGMRQHYRQAEVTAIEPGEFNHTIHFRTPDGEEHTMISPFVIDALGLGEPAPLNVPGKVETSATEDDVDYRRQFNIPDEDAHLWDGKSVVVVGYGNSGSEMVLQFQKLQDMGINVDYKVLTHYPEVALHNPRHKVDHGGRTWEWFRSDENPNGLAGDLQHHAMGFYRTLVNGDVVSDMRRWDIEGDEVVVTKTDGSQESVSKDVLIVLNGFRFSEGTLENFGLLVEDGKVEVDYDQEVVKEPGAKGGDRVHKGYFAVGPFTGTHPVNIGGIQEQVQTMASTFVPRTSEYRKRVEEAQRAEGVQSGEQTTRRSFWRRKK